MSEKDEPNTCEKHDVNIDRLPDRDRCPYCQMEERRTQARVERAMRRAPRSVDDPAPRGSYRR